MSCADLTYFALHNVYPCMFTMGIATTHTQPVNVCKHMLAHMYDFFLDSFLKSSVPSPVSYYNSDYVFLYSFLCMLLNLFSTFVELEIQVLK